MSQYDGDDDDNNDHIDWPSQAGDRVMTVAKPARGAMRAKQGRWPMVSLPGCLDSVLRPVGARACSRSPGEPGASPSTRTTTSIIIFNQWA